MDRTADIAIVGGGIVGLAHAYMALRKGYKVVLFEREAFATGASVRNFGLVWPIGQQPGVGLDRALRARAHWLTIAKEAGFWINTNGSLHLAYHDDEWAVLNEFMDIYRDAAYQCTLVTPEQTVSLSPVVKTAGLRGALYSTTEGTVYSREAIRQLPLWLEKKYGLMLRFGHVVTEIALPVVKTARETWHAQHVFVCSGSDFETLYPAWFDQQPVTKCKLHMMKATPSVPFTLGPTLCAGLTLRHYAAFDACPSLRAVDQRYDQYDMAFKEKGIHLLLAQNAAGELIIGDSHEYGRTLEPFDATDIDDKILSYLHTFTQLEGLRVTERWHGIYPKTSGALDLVLRPEKGVTIVTGLGGAGMSLSFGLAEEHLDQL